MTTGHYGDSSGRASPKSAPRALVRDRVVRVTFPIPLAQLGLGFTCQGVSLTPSLCLELTDPLLVTPQAP